MKRVVFCAVTGMMALAFNAFAGELPRKMERVGQNQVLARKNVMNAAIMQEKVGFVSQKKTVFSSVAQTEAQMLPASAKIEQRTFSKGNLANALREFRAEETAQEPFAMYWKPEGTMFVGVDKDTYIWMYGVEEQLAGVGGVVGGWKNGLDAWVYPNYSRDYTELNYASATIDADNPAILLEDGSLVDEYTPSMKGNVNYLWSWAMPYQTVKNELGADTFALCLPSKALLPELAEYYQVAPTIAGIPYIYDDGMWPLMNAPMSDCELGVFYSVLWNEGQYTLGTTPVTMEGVTGSDTTINVAASMTVYEKPQVPLYVEDITMWLGTETGVAPTLAEGDTLWLSIMDNRANVLASTYATRENLTMGDTQIGLGGGILTFPLVQRDEWGTTTSEGIVLTDTFNILVSGYNECKGNFGVYMALDRRMGGRTLMITEVGDVMQYALVEPFMMLNGVYSTLEYAFSDISFGSGPLDEPVDELVIEPTEFSDGSIQNLAVFDERSGNLVGMPPMLYSSFYPVDTINNTNNFVVEAPEWISWSFNDAYWGEESLLTTGLYGVLELYLFAEELPQGTAGREANVTVSCYGKSMTFHVTQGNPSSGIAETKVNTTKLFSTSDAFNFTYTDDFTSVDVYNVNGQKVSTYALPQTGTFSIAKAGLADGVYMFRMNGKTTEVLRAVK